MTALPKPAWGREGETWRAEEEPDLVVGPGYCGAQLRNHFDCQRPAVAVGRTNPRMALCPVHLAELRFAWIEDGRVVSWRLSR